MDCPPYRLHRAQPRRPRVPVGAEFTRPLWWALLPLVVVVFSAACTPAGMRGEQPDRAVPAPDFSLAFNVRGEGGADQPLHQPAHYVVDPGRSFRAATGPGATAELVPPPARRMEPADYAALWRAAYDAGLLARPAATTETDEPAADRETAQQTGEATTYTITIRAHGQRYRHETSADQNPGARRVLEMLVRLRLGRRALDEAPLPGAGAGQ